MTKLEALTDLLAKVKAGAFDPEPTRPLRWRFNKFAEAYELAFGLHNRNLEKVWDAYKGSLDAAMALHEAVLPGRGWFFEAGGTPRMCAGIFHEDVKTPPHIGKADTPSRAWLVAIIKALIAMEKNDD